MYFAKIPFQVITPLGKAYCTGIYIENEDIEHETWIMSTGECWWWRNTHIRFCPNVTNSLPEVSAFININSKLQNHIQRYKENGWL